MEFTIRPMTMPERMYCYTQSQQIMAQTGCIGHLRGDMGSSGKMRPEIIFLDEETLTPEELEVIDYDETEE